MFHLPLNVRGIADQGVDTVVLNTFRHLLWVLCGLLVTRLNPGWHNLKSLWRLQASDLEGRIRFLCLQRHHTLISFQSYNSGVGGEFAESLARRGGWETNDWSLFTTTQRFLALAGFQYPLGQAIQIVYCCESFVHLKLFLIFFLFFRLRDFMVIALMKSYELTCAPLYLCWE